MHFFRQKVLVVGLGKSGLSASRWLSQAGALVTVTDIREEDAFDRKVITEISGRGIGLEMGGHNATTFLESDMIVLSPGVPQDIKPLMEAREKGIPLIGEMGLAARLIDIPIVAVTGTNGKSTVTDLIGSMIKNAGLAAFVGGNIGTPLMDYVAEGRRADYAVLEVSSFQLDTMDDFCPDVAIILNISPDHLDRYPDYRAYVDSKLKIFKNQRDKGHYAIVNDDDEELTRFVPKGDVSLLRYGVRKRENRQAFIEGKKIRVSIPGVKSIDFSSEKIRLQGRHNLENLMAAVLAGLALGLAPKVIRKTLESFKGLPHRLELVRQIKGVDFIDDSKATNVDAASRSILSFEGPVILIAGGRHKGGDYSPLLKAGKGKVKKAILLGESKSLMARALEGGIACSLAEDMSDAVSQAFTSAGAGDVVLLAPACSSFDMFEDYTHRGMAFRSAVEGINNGG